MTPAEQAVIDRGSNTDGWSEVHNAFSSATLERVDAVSPQIAAAILGVDHLDEVGVVP